MLFYFFSKISDPRFIKYCFDYPKIKNHLLSLAKSSTAQPYLSIDKLLTVKFPKPPFEIQKKIGDILSAYDEIMENHERQIEILEGIRTSIYKRWFGQYKPNSSLPEGWKFLKIKDLATIKKGTKPANHAIKESTTNKQKTYPFFTCSIETQKSKTFSFEQNAIIISTRGIFHAKFFRGKFEASNNVFIFSEKYLKIQYFLFMKLKEDMKKRNKIPSGTTVNQINIKELKNIEILIPDKETLEKFNIICETIQTKIEKLTKKIKK